jgi:hypothetical protein
MLYGEHMNTEPVCAPHGETDCIDCGVVEEQAKTDAIEYDPEFAAQAQRDAKFDINLTLRSFT